MTGKRWVVWFGTEVGGVGVFGVQLRGAVEWMRIVGSFKTFEGARKASVFYPPGHPRRCTVIVREGQHPTYSR